MVGKFTSLKINQNKRNTTYSVSFGLTKETEALKDKSPKPQENKADFIIKEKIEKPIPKEISNFVREKGGRLNLNHQGLKIEVKEKPEKTAFFEYQKVKIPIADEKVIEGLRAPITSSLRWLATLAVYILKMAHIHLKQVRGRVIRVFKSY